MEMVFPFNYPPIYNFELFIFSRFKASSTRICFRSKQMSQIPQFYNESNSSGWNFVALRTWTLFAICLSTFYAWEWWCSCIKSIWIKISRFLCACYRFYRWFATARGRLTTCEPLNSRLMWPNPKAAQFFFCNAFLTSWDSDLQQLYSLVQIACSVQMIFLKR